MAKAHTVRITSIECNGTSDAGDENDEVVIIYQVDAGPLIPYPKKMSMNQPGVGSGISEWGLDLEISFDYDVLVTLWDTDPFNVLSGFASTDFLINVDYRDDNMPTRYTMTNDNGANYTINAERVS